MYAGFRPYQPATIHPQTDPWRADPADNVAIIDDQCFVRQFERNILATKTTPHVNAVHVKVNYLIC